MEGRDKNTMNRIENHLALDHNFPEKEPHYCQECSSMLGEYEECYHCMRRSISVQLDFPVKPPQPQRGAAPGDVISAYEVICENYLQTKVFYATSEPELKREAITYIKELFIGRDIKPSDIDIDIL